MTDIYLHLGCAHFSGPLNMVRLTPSPTFAVGGFIWRRVKPTAAEVKRARRQGGGVRPWGCRAPRASHFLLPFVYVKAICFVQFHGSPGPVVI